VKSGGCDLPWHRRSNGFRFLRQFIEYGLKDKMAVIGGMTALDEPWLRNMGRRGAGFVTPAGIPPELDNPAQQAFAEAFRKQFKYDPGYYAGGTTLSGQILEAGLKDREGKCGRTKKR